MEASAGHDNKGGAAPAAKPGRGRRLFGHVRRIVARILAVGIVSTDPDVRRRQRFVNVGALIGGLASLQHAVEQVARDVPGLEPLALHNLLFGILHLATPIFHRVSDNAGALWLCTAIIVGTAHVISLTGLDGGAHVYFAFTAGAFLFFGVKNWRLYLAVVAAALLTVVLSLIFAPKAGPIAVAAPGYTAELSAVIVINVIIINILLFTYALVQTHKAETALAGEVVRADTLLLAILPSAIAAKLKDEPEELIADRHEAATIFFADIAGFTSAARDKSPEELVAWLDGLFKDVDALADEYKVVKIKTIGDAYMAVSGLRVRPEVGAERVARFAIAFRDLAQMTPGLEGGTLTIRAGIHSGPVIAGVIGGTRFAYDLWGDAVNTASRMESTGKPGRVQISAATAALLPAGSTIVPRGFIEAKGLGRVETFWLEDMPPPGAVHEDTVTDWGPRGRVVAPTGLDL
ncbi:MAG: adenylate/guanylate cyclase domain-containing protein [Pseudomonadota bacterium]